MDMNDREKVQAALDKCELYLGNEKIERASIERYERFILDNFFSENRLAYISLIPSDKFLSCAFLIAGLLTYINSSMSIEEYIDSLIEEARENEQFRVSYEGQIFRIGDEGIVSGRLLLIGQKELRVQVPQKRWNLVLEYGGDAKRKVKHGPILKNRIDAYNKIFGQPTKSVMTDVVSYIVIEKKKADEILDRLYVKVDGMEKVKLSELFTVEYQNRDAECIQKYPGNLGERCSSICVCNDLVAVKNWAEGWEDDYPIAMLYVGYWEIIKRDIGFFQQIIDNKGISLQIYDFCLRFGLMKDVNDLQKADIYWGTTPTYLQQNPNLAAEISACASGTVTERYFDSDITDEEYQSVIGKLSTLRHERENSQAGFDFMRCAFWFIRWLRTECMPMDIENNFVNPYVDVFKKLKELQEDVRDSHIKGICLDIYGFVERLYTDICNNQYKYKKLKEILSDSPQGRKLLIVPYAKQCNILRCQADGIYNLEIMTPSKIKDCKPYDLVIVSGAFSLKDVPVFLHLRAVRTVFFLYGFEKKDHERRKSWTYQQLHNFEVLAKIAPPDGGIVPESNEETFIPEEPFDYIDISEIIDHFHPASEDSDIIQDKKVGVVRIGLLEDGRQYLFSKKKIHCLEPEKNKVQTMTVDQLSSGTSFLYCRDFGNRHDIIQAILQEKQESSDTFQRSLELVETWKACLAKYMEQYSTGWTELSKLIGIMGYPNSGGCVVRSWVSPNCCVIGPHDKEAYGAIKKIIARYDGDTTAEEYYKATEYMRHVHNVVTNQITKLLPYVYEETQRGKEDRNPVRKMLQDNLDEFVEVLTLSEIKSLKQQVMIPGNYVNVPLESEELMSFE